MHYEPNPHRLKHLRLDGYPLKSQLAFCDHCLFQQEPLTAGSPFCPDCNHRLIVVTVTDELIARCT